MASRTPREKRYVPPPPPDPSDFTETDAESLANGNRRKRRKRDANVYDAVAGRVTTTLPLDDGSSSPEPPTLHHHHQQKRRRPPRDHLRDPTLAPEDVLFARRRAPARFAEKDIYLAHEDLRDGGGGVLPDSDMLKAIHSYASEFYAVFAAARRSGGGGGGGGGDERSMDETALLALGILLEEAGREVLGERGDLVFTEGVEVTAPQLPGEGGAGEPRRGDRDPFRGHEVEGEIVGFRDVITRGPGSRRS